jgi:hypothetical protein
MYNAYYKANCHNIEMDLKIKGCKYVDWIQIAWGPVAGCYENGMDFMKGKEFLGQLSNYKFLKIHEIWAC